MITNVNSLPLERRKAIFADLVAAQDREPVLNAESVRRTKAVVCCARQITCDVLKRIERDGLRRGWLAEIDSEREAG